MEKGEDIGGEIAGPQIHLRYVWTVWRSSTRKGKTKQRRRSSGMAGRRVRTRVVMYNTPWEVT